jgi:hypothetical protein
MITRSTDTIVVFGGTCRVVNFSKRFLTEWRSSSNIIIQSVCLQNSQVGKALDYRLKGTEFLTSTTIGGQLERLIVSPCGIRNICRSFVEL